MMTEKGASTSAIHWTDRSSRERSPPACGRHLPKQGRRSLLPGEDVAELACLPPAEGDRGPLRVAHDDPVVARVLGNDLADGGEIDDERAVAPEELGGVEGRLQIGEGARDQVAVSAGPRED